MTIPPFVHIEHDTVTKKAFVTIEDREVRKQREMWGMMYNLIQLRASADISIQEPQELTFKTTSSGSQKDTTPFSV